MFTINQIKEAHSKVKSGADFPKYVQDLVQLGIIKYNAYVNDGHAKYFGRENFSIQSEAKYAMKEIAKTGDIEKFKHALKIHQQGQTDYLTFCEQSAQFGVEKWVVDMNEMTCIYYDYLGNKLLTEQIPQ